MPRAGRNKGHKGRRGGTKKTVRRPPKNAPRRGPALHERDGPAAAALLKQVGERLSTRPGVVRRVLQCFDYCELAHAVCVSRCWRATAEALMPRRLADFWADPDRSKLEEVLAKLDSYERFVEESQKEPPETPDGKPIRTAFPDPLLGRLALCWENGLGAHVLNDGATCRVGYVSLAEHLRGKNINNGMLIVAQDEELDKWRAAFSGKNYFRGGLDQDKNWTSDEEFRVYACSEKLVLRHGAWRNAKLWSLLVVDIGGRSARTMSRHLLSIQALSSHLVSCSVPRQGLDLAEALCRFEFVFKNSPDVYEWYIDNLSQSLGSRATPAERCLAELARRDLSKRLTSGAFALNVAAVAGARPKNLSRLPCVVCGRHGVEGEKLRVCGACGARAYCSKGCQRADWVGKPTYVGGGHRKTCLRTRRKRSRRICHVCGKRGDLAKEAFSLCMGCDRRYCSVECSDVDWASGHATECPGARATPAAETYGASAAGS